MLFPFMVLASACQAAGTAAPPPAVQRAANASLVAPVIPSVSVPTPGSLAPLVESVKGAVVNVEVQAREPVAAQGLLRLQPPGSDITLLRALPVPS
ncbi:uncharacterized protein STAUR_4461 [Stigmatella aurantiaca DW4/3-1]|uniref:Uncharacterized protein n=1 Tax=Stigmatella aurantiaca (strain DW4/3-1) TaxID=378806 RepID=E3FVM7_STIAD|nr:uncharacterized protein STAUR_4461 [Stigmatella aurantiaca DW4/3-1]